MLTKNGNIFLGKIDPTSSSAWIMTDGQILASNNGVSPYTINNYNQFSVIVGSSDIEPSINDYYLKDAKPLTQVSSTRLTPSSYEDDFIFNIKTVLRNDTNQIIVVKEVGIIGRSYGRDFLLYRDVLQEPITIQQNKSFLFDMTI